MTQADRIDVLANISYRDFLIEICGYDPQVADFYQTSTAGYFGVGIDTCSALDARANYNPGFDGMDLGEGVPKENSPSGRLALTDPDYYIYHFPDGNAGVARHLVHSLIPGAWADVPPGLDFAAGTAPAADPLMIALNASSVDYGRLDQPDNAVRIRLNSTVIRIAHDGPPESAESVTLTYASGGQLNTVTAGHVVAACWHRVIPYLTSEIGADQIAALNDQQKVPLIYTNV